MRLGIRWAAVLAAALLLPAAQAQDEAYIQNVRALILQLKEKITVLRKEAEEKLFQLGPRAIPLLKEEEAKLGAGDLKMRLSVVIKRMERDRKIAVARGRLLLVTASVKDKSVADVMEEFQKATAVPIDAKSIPSEVVTSLNAAGVSLWDAVDEICRNHGKLSWDVSGKGIVIKREAYAKPFLATSLGYGLILRRFVRYPPGAGTGDRDYLQSDFDVAAPPGATIISRYIVHDELVDDKGADLLKASAGLVKKPPSSAFRILPEPDEAKLLYVSVPDFLDPVASRGVTKIKSCRGAAFLRVVIDMKPTAEIRGAALKKDGRSDAGGISLRIDRYDVTGDSVRLDLSVVDSRAGERRHKSPLAPEWGGRIVVKDTTGRDLGAEAQLSGDPVREGGATSATETSKFRVTAKLKDKAQPGSIEIHEPVESEEIKVAFDFKDIPVRKPK